MVSAVCNVVYLLLRHKNKQTQGEEHKGTKMPRQKSEITKGVYVNIRMSKEQKEFFMDMGGADWLRNLINRQLQQEQIQTKEVKND